MEYGLKSFTRLYRGLVYGLLRGILGVKTVAHALRGFLIGAFGSYLKSFFAQHGRLLGF